MFKRIALAAVLRIEVGDKHTSGMAFVADILYCGFFCVSQDPFS